MYYGDKDYGHECNDVNDMVIDIIVIVASITIVIATFIIFDLFSIFSWFIVSLYLKSVKVSNNIDNIFSFLR